MKPTLDALREEAPRNILNSPKDLVAFALATGGHLRLVSPSGPGVAQRAPLRKAGLIFKQDQTLTTLGRPENGRPFLHEPGQALGRVEMIRHKTGLLKRKAQVVQQRTDIMAIVEHPKFTPDQHTNEHTIPTGRLTAYRERTGLNQLDQAFLLFGSQLLGARPTIAVDQAVQAAQYEGLLPGIE